VQAQRNQAVFEVPQILERILREATAAPKPVAESSA
jgi:hypothetical protein